MITKDALVEAMRAQATAHPNRTYNRGHHSCLYAPSREVPHGCIVGEALQALGVPVDTLRRVDALSANSETAWEAPGGQVRTVLESIVADEAIADEWISKVQEYQDLGYSWSEAVARTDRLARA
jgi:hypothetical protein